MDEEILAVVTASAPRRWVGVGMLAAVGGLMIYLAFSVPSGPVWQVALVALGATTLWMADRMWRATRLSVVLSAQELRASNGERIALVADIEALDRSAFAFKPSNGFLIRTRTTADRAWRPGLWWRMGRRIGVGGVTPGAQTKIMSETLTMLLAQRDQASDQTT